MSATLEQERVDVERALGMLHYEHPERIGEAFCGAPVVGVRGYFGRVECVVCADLMREHRRAARMRPR